MKLKRKMAVGFASCAIVATVSMVAPISPSSANTQCMNLKHSHVTHGDNDNPTLFGVSQWPYLYARSVGQYTPFTQHRHELRGCPNGYSL